jgi:hypothetical protein
MIRRFGDWLGRNPGCVCLAWFVFAVLAGPVLGKWLMYWYTWVDKRL